MHAANLNIFGCSCMGTFCVKMDTNSMYAHKADVVDDSHHSRLLAPRYADQRAHIRTQNIGERLEQDDQQRKQNRVQIAATIF